MDDLKKMLEEIKKNPRMYLGKISLELLSAFINGYLCRKYYEEFPCYPEFYPGFQEYIQKIYGITSSHGWADIIIFYSADDKEAFYNFYEHLEDYLNKK